MVLSTIDRELLQRCLDRKDRAWSEFTDRYVGLILLVIQHTAESKAVSLDSAIRDDLAAEVFLALIRDDFAVLRRFRGNSSLATYITVVARRVVVRKMIQWKLVHKNALSQLDDEPVDRLAQADDQSEIDAAESTEEIEHAIHFLAGNEATAIRMYHLEGKSYQEISSRMGMPENSVGPLLTRAREKMRKVLEP